MKICFSCMNKNYFLGLLDLVNQEVKFIPNTNGKNPFRPFGITWDDDQFYVAQANSVVDLNCNVLIPGLWNGLHQALSHDGFLYLISPNISCLKRINLVTKKIDYLHLDSFKFYDTVPEACKSYDKNKFSYDLHHFNSIFIQGNKAFISAHNHDDPSFVLEFDYPNFNLIKKHDKMGSKIHNVFVENDEIYTIDSCGSRCIASNKNKQYRITSENNMFCRGLAVSRDYFITSYFPEATRRDREKGDAFVVMINRQTGTKENEIKIKDIGSISDIRLIDEYDYAHCKGPYNDLTSLIELAVI